MDVARTLLEDIAHSFVGHSDPRAQLDTLERDRQIAEIEIRAVLDRLASKYDVASDDVDQAMENIGLAIGDMTYEPETEYLENIDLKPMA